MSDTAKKPEFRRPRFLGESVPSTGTEPLRFRVLRKGLDNRLTDEKDLSLEAQDAQQEDGSTLGSIRPYTFSVLEKTPKKSVSATKKSDRPGDGAKRKQQEDSAKKAATKATKESVKESTRGGAEGPEQKKEGLLGDPSGSQAVGPEHSGGVGEEAIETKGGYSDSPAGVKEPKGESGKTRPAPPNIPDAMLQSRGAESQGLSEEQAARISEALDHLDEAGKRLAASARSDILELACIVARKILDAELKTSVDPLFRFIRALIERAGKSKIISLRLSVEDHAIVEEHRNKKQGDESESFANIELVSDSDLGRGDVLLETEFGLIDGRLDAQIDRIKKAARESLDE